FFFQAEDGIRDKLVTGVQTCALPIYAVMGCARVEAGLEGLAEPFDRARALGKRDRVWGDAVFIGGGGGEANENGCQQRGVEDGTVKRCGLNGSRSSRLKEALTISDFGFRTSGFEVSLVTSAAT